MHKLGGDYVTVIHIGRPEMDPFSNRISMAEMDLWTNTDGITSKITINDCRSGRMECWSVKINHPLYWNDLGFMCEAGGGIYGFVDWLKTASDEDIELRLMEKKLGDI